MTVKEITASGREISTQETLSLWMQLVTDVTSC